MLNFGIRFVTCMCLDCKCFKWCIALRESCSRRRRARSAARPRELEFSFQPPGL